MNFGKCLGVVVLWLGCSLAACAQFGVYAEYSATSLTGIRCLDPQGVCSAANGAVKPSGVLGGVYYDFRNVGPVRLGLDLRGGTGHSNKSAVNSGGGENITHATTGMAGLRGSFHTPINWIKPYLQASVGITRTNATEVTIAPYDNFLRYEFMGGLDFKILPILDLRAIELGIGNMNRVGSGTGTDSVGVKSIGVGLVFHLPAS